MVFNMATVCIERRARALHDRETERYPLAQPAGRTRGRRQGAKLVFVTLHVTPDEFVVQIPQQGRSIRYRVIWRRGASSSRSLLEFGLRRVYGASRASRITCAGEVVRPGISFEA